MGTSKVKVTLKSGEEKIYYYDRHPVYVTRRAKRAAAEAAKAANMAMMDWLGAVIFDAVAKIKTKIKKEPE